MKIGEETVADKEKDNSIKKNPRDRFKIGNRGRKG
jgi:hypothetical protein